MSPLDLHLALLVVMLLLLWGQVRLRQRVQILEQGRKNLWDRFGGVDVKLQETSHELAELKLRKKSRK